MKEKLLLFNNPDIVCVTETHLKNNDQICIEGYKYYGLNRLLLNKHALRGSGGIGVLVKNVHFNNYLIKTCYEWKDNLFGLKLENKYSSETLIVYCIYVPPPESSRYAKETEKVFNNLVIEIYSETETDNISLCGDFNARVGRKADVLNCDIMPERRIVDHETNKRGDRLLTFIKDIKGCIVNGRITPENDDFTSVTSHKGRAVVDYCLTRQSDLNSITNMQVISSLELRPVELGVARV